MTPGGRSGERLVLMSAPLVWTDVPDRGGAPPVHCLAGGDGPIPLYSDVY